MDFLDLINNVGFPITVSVALFYQLMKTNELVREFQTTIVNNTNSIERLANSLEKQKGE